MEDGVSLQGGALYNKLPNVWPEHWAKKVGLGSQQLSADEEAECLLYGPRVTTNYALLVISQFRSQVLDYSHHSVCPVVYLSMPRV